MELKKIYNVTKITLLICIAQTAPTVGVGYVTPSLLVRVKMATSEYKDFFV
jgi:hypothetical protein